MLPNPRTITFSLIEALALAHLGDIKRDVMVVLAGSFLVSAVWFFL